MEGRTTWSGLLGGKRLPLSTWLLTHFPGRDTQHGESDSELGMSTPHTLLLLGPEMLD